MNDAPWRYSPADYGLKRRHVFDVPFKLISKSNDKSHFLPKRYRDFENALAQLAAYECKRPMHKAGWVVIRPAFKNKTHCDPNNLTKGVMDALKKGGVYTDDKAWSVTVTPVYYNVEPSIIEIWA